MGNNSSALFNNTGGSWLSRNKIGQQPTDTLNGNMVMGTSPSQSNSSYFNTDASTDSGLANYALGVPKADGSNPFDFLGSEKGLNTIQGIGALGSLGLGLASFLSNQKMLKKQGALMDQQLANNATEMQRRTNTLDYYNKEGAAMKDKLNAIPQSNPLRTV